MIFIGIFGIQDKVKMVKEYNNVVCRCGLLSKAEVYKEYRYFHIFFIPVYRWKTSYFVRMRCCSDVYQISPEHYSSIETNLDFDSIFNAGANLAENEKNECVSCKRHIHSDFSFCPYCGRKLDK